MKVSFFLLLPKVKNTLRIINQNSPSNKRIRKKNFHHDINAHFTLSLNPSSHPRPPWLLFFPLCCRIINLHIPPLADRQKSCFLSISPSVTKINWLFWRLLAETWPNIKEWWNSFVITTTAAWGAASLSPELDTETILCHSMLLRLTGRVMSLQKGSSARVCPKQGIIIMTAVISVAKNRFTTRVGHACNPCCAMLPLVLCVLIN